MKPTAISHEEMMALTARAAVGTFEIDATGRRSPLSMRELHMVMFIRDVASGELKIGDARAKAAGMLAFWKKQADEQLIPLNEEQRIDAIERRVEALEKKVGA